MLGLLNYYRRFIPAPAEKVEPLLSARFKESKWSKEQHKPFCMPFTHLSEAPGLQPYSMENMRTLTVDIIFYCNSWGVIQGSTPSGIHKPYLLSGATKLAKCRERSLHSDTVHEWIATFSVVLVVV